MAPPVGVIARLQARVGVQQAVGVDQHSARSEGTVCAHEERVFRLGRGHVVQRERGGEHIARGNRRGFEVADHRSQPGAQPAPGHGQHRLVAVDADDTCPRKPRHAARRQSPRPRAEVHQRADRAVECIERTGCRVENIGVVRDEREDLLVVLAGLDPEMLGDGHDQILEWFARECWLLQTFLRWSR